MISGFFLALISYSIFFVIQIYLVKVFTKPHPNSSMASRYYKIAIVFSIIYLVLQTLSGLPLNLDTIAHWFIFSFILFSLHIPWFSNLMALPTRSISANYLIELDAIGGETTVKAIIDENATSQNFDLVNQDRIGWMLHYGILKRNANGTLSLDTIGKILDFSRRFFLNLWGLEQLGK